MIWRYSFSISASYQWSLNRLAGSVIGDLDAVTVFGTADHAPGSLRKPFVFPLLLRPRGRWECVE